MADDAAFRLLFDVIRLRIRQARRTRGLSQEDVAGKIPADVRILQRYEARESDVSDPRLKSLYKIAMAIGIDLADLLRPPSENELRELEDRD
ncbi:MAG: helix-turn-helix transcriptional regulator [Trueperaceae bacterium]